jgi:hypothetical protein
MRSEETPDILDALIAASVKAGVQNLVRTARRQRILSGVALGGAALVVLGVPAALLAGTSPVRPVARKHLSHSAS